MSDFGPWATAAGTGSKALLSTFWKRRLALLPVVYRSAPRLGLGSILLLALAAALVWGLPTFLNAPAAHSQAAEEPKPAADVLHVEGVVMDEAKHPLAGTEVRAYDPGYGYRLSQRFLQKTITDAEGRFQLDVPPHGKMQSSVLYFSKQGFASRAMEWSGGDPLPSRIPDAVLSKPESLRGRVTGPEGQPVAGADVWVPIPVERVEGVFSTKTDANGYFEIPDLEPWDGGGMVAFAGIPTPEQLAEASKFRAEPGKTGKYMRVQHPDYGLRCGLYARVPDTVNVSFNPPAVLTGRLVDRATGKPLSGMVVRAQNVKNYQCSNDAVTDPQGAFRLLMQEAGECRLWIMRGDWATQQSQAEAVLGRTVDLAEIPVTLPASPAD